MTGDWIVLNCLASGGDDSDGTSKRLIPPLRFAVVEDFTPERCARDLAAAPPNRKISKGKLKKLERDLRDGEWHEDTGETIKYDVNGKVRDGQHRMQACVNTGIPFRSAVVYNVSEEALKFVDTGKVRTGSDLLHMAGRKNADLLASTVNWAHCIQPDGGVLLTGSLRPDKIEQYVNELPLYEEMVAVCGRVRVVITAMLAALGVHILSRCPEARPEFEQFVEDIHTGAGLEPGDSVLALRARVHKMKLHREKCPKDDQLSWVINAWNHRCEGTKNKALRGTVLTEDKRRLVPAIALPKRFRRRS